MTRISQSLERSGSIYLALNFLPKKEALVAILLYMKNQQVNSLLPWPSAVHAVPCRVFISYLVRLRGQQQRFVEIKLKRRSLRLSEASCLQFLHTPLCMKPSETKIRVNVEGR